MSRHPSSGSAQQPAPPAGQHSAHTLAKRTDEWTRADGLRPQTTDDGWRQAVRVSIRHPSSSALCGRFSLYKLFRVSLRRHSVCPPPRTPGKTSRCTAGCAASCRRSSRLRGRSQWVLRPPPRSFLQAGGDEREACAWGPECQRGLTRLTTAREMCESGDVIVQLYSNGDVAPD